ncbi:threonine dehydratase [Proteus mirabilis]|uniref:Threonine dehydratase n=1 Tax=Proteus mirabilis TaxID=584 RepID=A0A379FEF3_PROMI|nr:threonine dehydratase [Proteus mirabilis]
MAAFRPLTSAPSSAEYLKAALSAPVYEAAVVTPLQEMAKISQRLENTILVKREDRQPVHSFKLRGAYNMIAGLTPEQKAKGVVTASAGNHAQGVALSANRMGRKSINCDAYCNGGYQSGCRTPVLVVKHCCMGLTLMKQKQKPLLWQKRWDIPLWPPFDHPAVIAGQATLAMELLQQRRPS